MQERVNSDLSQTSYTNLNVHAATQPRTTQSMRLGNQLGLVVWTLQKSIVWLHTFASIA